MSSPAALLRKSRCIIWTVASSGDGYGDTYGIAHDIACQYVEDGKVQRDSNGQEFTPSGKFSIGVKPKLGDYIKVIGANDTATAMPPTDAMQIRKIGSGTAFHGSADYLAYTG